MEASKDTAPPTTAVANAESLSFVNCVGTCFIATRLD